MIRPLSAEDARNLLERGRVGRLGCIAENEPYVIPVSYFLEDDCVYVHTMPGLKVTALRANPRACLQVDEVRDEYHWKSAIGFGRYEELAEPAERDRALNNLLEGLVSVPAEQVGAQLLALQTQLEASMRVTALLAQTSLVKMLG